MPISEARKRANAKYNAKAYDRLELKVPKGKKGIIVAHAENHDGSLNKFLNRAVDEAIERDIKKPDNNVQGKVSRHTDGEYHVKLTYKCFGVNGKDVTKNKTVRGFKTEEEALEFIRTFNPNASKEDENV
jgi:hypothetical protein